MENKSNIKEIDFIITPPFPYKKPSWNDNPSEVAVKIRLASPRRIFILILQPEEQKGPHCWYNKSDGLFRFQ